MSASTQTYVFEVEELLKSFGEELAAKRLREAPLHIAGFDSRPVVATLLAFLIFAPGCAAAAVFLMKADNIVPPFVAPDSNGPFIAKSDRLPLSEWGSEASAGAQAKFIARTALEDPGFLAPVLIRGSLEDAFFTKLPEVTPAAALDAMAAVPAEPKPRPRREVRRARPPAKLVAEAAPPEPPPPSFLEKLFGLRSL